MTVWKDEETKTEEEEIFEHHDGEIMKMRSITYTVSCRDKESYFMIMSSLARYVRMKTRSVVI